MVRFPDALWRSRRFLVELSLSSIAAAGALGLLTRYLQFNERRPGVVLPDPLLALLEPRDLSWVIFGLVYLTAIIAIVGLLRHPYALLVATRAYTLMIGIRVVVMYLAPFAPPEGLVDLTDPLAAVFGVG